MTLLLFSTSCKKIVEDTKKNYVLDMMTNGQWIVETYLKADTNLTADFNGYAFQFYEDGTVKGIKDNIGEEGTWKEDIINYSIISQFPGAGNPVARLNGTWKLKDSSNDFVLAEMTTDSGKNTLKLRKKQ